MQNDLYLERTGSSDRNLNIDIHRNGHMFKSHTNVMHIKIYIQKNLQPEFMAS